MQIGSSGGLAFGDGALTQVIADGAAVRSQLDTLTRQAGDGLVADTYSGLGSTASVSLTLGTQLSNVQTWQNNAQTSAAPMQVAQTALSQISSIASTFFSDAATLTGVNPSAIDSTAASARDALQQVAQLLDSQYGGDYVFAGTDSANPPVPDPGNILSSGFVEGISAAVSSLGTNGATATIASTLAIASSNASGVSPFSVTLSQPAAALQGDVPMVQTGPDQFTQVGILASTNASAPSNGSSTTGSYIRDILRGLATIGSMSSSQASTTGFTTLVQDTQTSLGGAISALNQDAGVLGNRQSALSSTQQSLGDVSTTLQAQISNVQNVDMASTLSQLSTVQAQLQASYTLLNTMRSLSLATVLATTS
jgi:flagellin-like hook-associated protein FlgL